MTLDLLEWPLVMLQQLSSGRYGLPPLLEIKNIIGSRKPLLLSPSRHGQTLLPGKVLKLCNLHEFCCWVLQDYVATRWYRAPELCGSFFSKVSSTSTLRSIELYVL